MKRFLRNEYKPKDLENLKNGIKEFWRALMPAVCTRMKIHVPQSFT